jgi:hypothetical protein
MRRVVDVGLAGDDRVCGHVEHGEVLGRDDRAAVVLADLGEDGLGAGADIHVPQRTHPRLRQVEDATHLLGNGVSGLQEFLHLRKWQTKGSGRDGRGLEALVDQQIGPGRRLDDEAAGAGVAGEDDLAPCVLERIADGTAGKLKIVTRARS